MYLLDTNVVSELRKVTRGRADPNFAAWAASVESESLYVSAITIQELEIGVLLVERRDLSPGAVLDTGTTVSYSKPSTSASCRLTPRSPAGLRLCKFQTPLRCKTP